MSDDGRLLIPGETCWRVETAERFGCIIDAADYFLHAKSAMLHAQRRIMLIGWDFDTRMTFERGDKTLSGPNRLGTFLRWLLRTRPKLEIYVLISNLGMVPALQRVWHGMTPAFLVSSLSSSRMRFAVDGTHPTGSVHHQKIAVIDDELAFCGGLDFTIARWDTSEHGHHNRSRRAVGRYYPPRHEVAAAVDGAAARALSEQARDRWQAAVGQSLTPVDAAKSVWPRDLEPILRDTGVAIARTLPALDTDEEVREVETLNLAAIAAAQRTIYLENQYLASRKLADALAARLQEPDAPEIVIVLPRNSESRIEEHAMDGARHRLLHMLWEADEYDRLGVYWPVTDGGEPIYVHSKVLVCDDRLLRIGSSNLNNRSLGFDSECDLAVEADRRRPDAEDVRRAIVSLRDRLVCEHLGVAVDELEQAMDDCGSFLRAIETLRGQGKTLRRFTDRTVAGEASPLAENDLMDPDHVPRSLPESVQRFIAGLTD